MLIHVQSTARVGLGIEVTDTCVLLGSLSDEFELWLGILPDATAAGESVAADTVPAPERNTHTHYVLLAVIQTYNMSTYNARCKYILRYKIDICGHILNSAITKLNRNITRDYFVCSSHCIVKKHVYQTCSMYETRRFSMMS